MPRADRDCALPRSGAAPHDGNHTALHSPNRERAAAIHLDAILKRTRRLADLTAMDDSPDEKPLHLDERLAARLAERLAAPTNEEATIEPDLALALLDDAVQARASDLHLEPREDGLAVRLRIDGGLREAALLPHALGRRLGSQLRTLARLDPVPAFRPEDARLTLDREGRRIDIRLASVPCLGGEKIGVRLLDSEDMPESLEALGLGEAQANALRQWLTTRSGLFLAVGPAGAGKTTTAHHLLRSRESDEHVVLTLEDPVEYRLDGTTQIEIDPDHDLSYPQALRAALRLDPDYLLVGEVRDEISARTAVRAAVTGHAVLATLHAPTASAAVTPLLSRGVAPHELAASLSVVVAQRLVRRLCTSCRQMGEPEPAEVRWLEAAGFDAPDELWRPGSCDACLGGYRGRIGVFEVWSVSDDDRDAIAAGAEEHVLWDALRDAGVPSLLDDAVEKANEGRTSIHELRRVPDLLRYVD